MSYRYDDAMQQKGLHCRQYDVSIRLKSRLVKIWRDWARTFLSAGGSKAPNSARTYCLYSCPAPLHPEPSMQRSEIVRLISNPTPTPADGVCVLVDEAAGTTTAGV